MKTKQTFRNLIGGLLLVAGITFASMSLAAPVSAVCDPDLQSCCGGVETTLITCKEDGSGSNPSNSGAWGILLVAINILTAGVGVAALGGIVYGAILYITAAGSPEQVKKAMGIFTNVVIGVVAYAGMYALLNFLVPGGLFSKNGSSGGSSQTTTTPTDTTTDGTSTDSTRGGGDSRSRGGSF